MTAARLQLREYESRVLELPDEAARRLATTVSPALAVTPTADSGRWLLTASGQVGTIVTPGLHILIRPKVDIDNVLALLDGGISAEAFRTEDVGLASAQDLLVAFVEFFVRSVHRATSRGLLRTYREEHEVLVAPRGRIDFAAHTRRAMLPSPLECRFDEFTSDVLENQLLLGSIERLLLIAGLPPRVRSELRLLRSRFEGVTSIRPHPLDFEQLTFNRLTEHYRAPLRLARLIAENLSLRDQHGQTSVTSFLLDMPLVYEDYVTRRLRAALRGRLEVAPQTQLWLGVGQRVPIRPDLEFRYGRQAVFVGDVKYKLASRGLARSSDYYQLLAYCQALDVREGVLIYAQAEDESPISSVTVKHSGVRLHTYRLDIGGSSRDLLRATSALASWITDRTLRAAMRS